MYYFLAALTGLLLRILLIPSPGFKADIGFWKAWGLAVVDKGIIWLTTSSNYNYPPGFAYVLYVINSIYNLFANPYIIEEYWHERNLLYLSLIKGLTIVSDVLIMVLIVLIAKKLKSKLGYFAALLYFLNPAAMFDGALWGQVDQFGLMLFLTATLFLFDRKYWLASAVYAVSILMKLQNIIFIPIFFLFIMKDASLKKCMSSIGVAMLTFIVVTIPFFIQKLGGSLIHLFTMNADWFPMYSLNAFNMWWLASGEAGMQVSDKQMVIGLLTAKDIGMYLFIWAYFLGVVALFFATKSERKRTFIIVCTWTVLSFFQLLTQSHERYAFHVVGLIPVLLLMIEGSIQRRRLIIFYVVFSVLFFLNLYIAMYFNYPDVVFWPFRYESASLLSRYVSYGQIAVLLTYLGIYMRPLLIKNWLYIGVFMLALGGLIYQKQAPYIHRQPIPLSNIIYKSQQQDYFYPIMDRAISSVGGPSHWSRLSNNYYFYEKGLGSHADSAIHYELKGRFSKFRSDYGIDTGGDVTASMIFSVEADGKKLYTSEAKGRFDPPSHVALDIKGVNILTLKINRVGESNHGAHGNWLGPEIIR